MSAVPVAELIETLAAREPTGSDDSKCRVCGKTINLSRCARCKCAVYDSAECQKSDWKAHKEACSRICEYRKNPAQLLRFVVALDTAEATAEVTLVDPAPAPNHNVDLDAARRVEFIVDAAKTVAESAGADEDGDEDMLAQLAHVGAGRGIKGCLAVRQAEACLGGLDGRADVVVEGEQTLRFTYPLDSAAVFRVRPSAGRLTRADVALVVSKVYEIIYAMDASSGLFGVRLHSIDDLSLHSMYETGKNAWNVAIDS
eukprot:m51a1_g2653 hypothetical protein (257) ;mRNA; f:627132-628212